MHVIAFIAGVLLIGATLIDSFESILLPRRINHRFRYSRLYYQTSWRLWRTVALQISAGKWREAMLSVFGPLSLLGLFGSWIITLILGFAIVQWSLAALTINGSTAERLHSFGGYFYFSGTTYFTLGLGDVVPSTHLSRVLTVVESGLGFGFLAIIISYLPVLYQAFSKREGTISLLDARAGSPPTGAEFLRRLLRAGRITADNDALREWERWCAELLESHISFPVLAFYRSQHANQSWLAALTSMLDSCALLLTLLPAEESHQAQLTFAMARHAAIDIGLIFGIRPLRADQTHSPRVTVIPLNELLQSLGKPTSDTGAIQSRLSELRAMYEPFLEGLAVFFAVAIPPMLATKRVDDNWQRSAWMSRAPGIGDLSSPKSGPADHFN